MKKRVKFSNNWKITAFWNKKILPAIAIRAGESGSIQLPFNEWEKNKKEAELIARLIQKSPVMFYTIVRSANYTGHAELFYILKDVIGYDVLYGSDEWKKLVDDANDFIKEEYNRINQDN